MPASRHIALLLAGTALAVSMSGAVAQQNDRPVGQSRAITSGQRGAPAPADGASTPRIAASPTEPGDALSGPRPATSAAGPGTGRQGLRPPKTRRSRLPFQGSFKGDFRQTLAPPGIAADVQPLQTGLPDTPPPPAVLKRKPVIDDPYAPLGLRVGNVVITPTLGQSFGYDTNPNRLGYLRRPSALSQTELELGIQSDWSRHDLYGQLRGAYSEYFDNPAARRPEGAGNLRLRLDVTRDAEIDIEGHYLIDTQRSTSPDLNAPVVTRPVVFSEGGSIGYTQRFNRLIATLRGTIDRTDYQDARLPGGLVLDQSDRAYTQYGLRGRLGYELNPGLIPFVEGIVDTRQYDRTVDRSGFARSSDGLSLRGGTLIELSRLVTAEIAAGVQVRDYQDQRLGTLTSPVADAVLSYALTPLTTIRATAAASVEETIVPGARGIRFIRGGLEVAHALRRNLTLSAGLRASDAVYQGVEIDERGLGAFIRADYRLNRNVALRASYTYDNIRSSVPNFSYASNTFLLGVRLTP